MHKFTISALLLAVVISAGLATNIALCQSTNKNNETNKSSNNPVASGNFVLDEDMFVKAIAAYEAAFRKAEGLGKNEKNNYLKEAREEILKNLLAQIGKRNKQDTANSFCFLNYTVLSSNFLQHSPHRPDGSNQNALNFFKDEFPSDSGSNADFKITNLCTAIINDNYGISLNSKVNSIAWLNELLEMPGFYDIVCVIKRIQYSEVVARLTDRRTLDNGNTFSKFNNNVRRLNRILLEAIYPDKIQKPRINLNGDGFEASNLSETKIAINELLKALKGAKNGAGNMLSTESFVQMKLSEIGAGLRKSPLESKLCDSIIAELKLRNVDVKNPSHHVVLVSEWDSFYGRCLPQIFIMKVLPQCPDWIHRFSYLCGIDGQLPNQHTADPRGTERQEKAQKTGKNLKDEMYLPTGRNQFDYLLGLARQISCLNEKLKQGGKGEIKAIGVLGSDVYDKLLVLQALRPQFPSAVFFTTDLDASMLQPSQYAWARNLVVVSNFGLVLSDSIQKTVPPFRNSYQTSLFFTTLLALSNNALFPKDEAPRQDLIDRFLTPKIFEVGRSGAVELLTKTQEGRDDRLIINGTTVENIHPPLKEPFFTASKARFLLNMFLQLVFLLGTIYVVSDWIKKCPKAYYGFGIGITILFTSLPFAISNKNWGLWRHIQYSVSAYSAMRFYCKARQKRRKTVCWQCCTADIWPPINPLKKNGLNR